MSQSESAYSAIADWHWTTSNTPEVAMWAPYGDVGTSQRQSGDVRTWGHVGKIGPRIRQCAMRRSAALIGLQGDRRRCAASAAEVLVEDH